MRKKAYSMNYTRLIFSFLFLLISLLSISYQYLMLPDVLEKLVKNIFDKHTGGKIELKIKKASLFYGFEIENCRLSVRKTKEELLYFKRGRFSTFLPGLLAGEFSLRNLTLEGGRLHIKYKRERWNWGLVFNPKGDQREEEEKEDIKVPDKISLFFPVRLHAKVDLRDFSYYMDVDKDTKEGLTKAQQRSFALQVEAIDLQLGLITRTFSEIPLSLEIAYLFDTLALAVNPKKSIRFHFQSQAEIKGSPKLRLFVFRERTRGKAEFHSRFLIDSRDLQFRNKRGGTLNIDWQASYDMFYDSQADRLLVNSLELRNKAEPWFSVRAAVNHLSSVRPSLQLDIKDAYIDLQKIGKLIAGLAAMPKVPVDGKIKIAHISLFGGLDNLRLKSKFEAQNLFLKLGQEHRIQKLFMDLDAQLDVHKFIPLQEETTNYQTKGPLAFGLFRYLNLRQFEVLHEKVYLKAEAKISSQKGTEAQISLRDCELGFFTERLLEGKGEAQINLRSSSDFTKTNFDLDLILRNAAYTLRRSRSRPIHLSLRTQGKVDFQKGIKLDLHSLKLRGKNIRGRTLIEFRTQGALAFEDSSQSYLLKKSQLSINTDRLYPTLPQFLSETLAPFRTYMANKASKTLALNSPVLRFENTKSKSILLGQGRLEIPALNLNDLDFAMDIQIGEKQILFKKATLRGLRGALAGDLQGKIEKHKEWNPNLNASFRVFSNTFLRVHENISVQGDLNLKARLLPEKLQASINTNNLNFEFLSGNCKTLNNADCRSLFVHQLVLDNLQIEHLRKPSPFSRKTLSGPQNNYEQRSYDIAKYNFRIGRITSSHNPRREYMQAPKRWHYIGRPGGKPGLRAVLAYQNNTLSIDRIELSRFHLQEKQKRVRWLKNGIIRGKDIYFNLFDLKAENMSAAWKLKIQNLDLEPFLPLSRSNYDGIISADFKGQINSFGDDILEKIKASLIVHQISPEFGGFITRILVPAQVVAFLVRNTLEIPSIKFRLQDGLAYSYIQVQRARILPGALLSSASEEIKQERMPIAQFLKRAKSETRDFGESSQTNLQQAP